MGFMAVRTMRFYDIAGVLGHVDVPWTLLTPNAYRYVSSERPHLYPYGHEISRPGRPIVVPLPAPRDRPVARRGAHGRTGGPPRSAARAACTSAPPPPQAGRDSRGSRRSRDYPAPDGAAASAGSRRNRCPRL